MAALTAGAPTRRQITALQARFRAAGYTRAERLATAAAVLGTGQLHSFTALSRGQAGVLLGWSRHGIPTRPAAPAATPAPRPDHPRPRAAAVHETSGLPRGLVLTLAVAAWLMTPPGRPAAILAGAGQPPATASQPSR